MTDNSPGFEGRITRGDMEKKPNEHIPGAEDTAFADHRHLNIEPEQTPPGEDNKYLGG